MSGRPIDRLLPNLKRVKKTGDVTWMASCPTALHQHGDRSRGLSIRELEDGTILLHCFAECGSDLILKTLGLEWGDLFPQKFDLSKSAPTVRPIPWQDAFKAMEESLVFADMAFRTLAHEGISPEDAEAVARHIENLHRQIARLRYVKNY